jgi:hypothetical protein
VVVARSVERAPELDDEPDDDAADVPGDSVDTTDAEPGVTIDGDPTRVAEDTAAGDDTADGQTEEF